MSPARPTRGYSAFARRRRVRRGKWHAYRAALCQPAARNDGADAAAGRRRPHTRPAMDRGADRTPSAAGRGEWRAEERAAESLGGPQGAAAGPEGPAFAAAAIGWRRRLTDGAPYGPKRILGLSRPEFRMSFKSLARNDRCKYCH